MNLHRYYALFAAGALIVSGWLVMAVLDPDLGGRFSEYIGLGYLFGTMFAHTTLAAAWPACGPFPLYVRFPASMVWVGALVIALACNIGLHGGPGDVVAMMICCLLGQWLLVQLPLWLLTLGYGLRLQHRGQPSRQAGPRDRQFGIRQVMILTAVVALFLGAGRALVPRIAASLSLQGEGPIFIFLAVAAIVVTVPLLLASLLPRMAVPAVISTLIILGLATALEMPLLSTFQSLRGGPDVGHFIGINAFTAVWILAVVGILRVGGYGLALPANAPVAVGES